MALTHIEAADSRNPGMSGIIQKNTLTRRPRTIRPVAIH